VTCAAEGESPGTSAGMGCRTVAILHYRLVKRFRHRAGRSGAGAGGFAGEVPDGDGEGEGAEEVGHHGQLAAMDLPALPEGDGGGEQHDEASCVVHGRDPLGGGGRMSIVLLRGHLRCGRRRLRALGTCGAADGCLRATGHRRYRLGAPGRRSWAPTLRSKNAKDGAPPVVGRFGVLKLRVRPRPTPRWQCQVCPRFKMSAMCPVRTL
jgi:hypothetical protein